MLSTLSKALRMRSPAVRRSASVPAASSDGEEELGRAQRLEKVVAGGGDEARLRGVGALGFGEGVGEGEGALVDPPLEALVRRLERALGLALGGDVGEADDEAAVGHLAGRKVEARARPGCGGRARAAARRRARTQAASVSGASPATWRRRWSAKAAKPRPTRRSCIGGARSVAQAGVPADEPALGVEDGDALVDVVEGGADQDRLLVEELVALLPLELDELGDVGMEDRGAAAGGALLADLHPAVGGGLDVEGRRRQAVVAEALAHPLGPAAAVGEGEMRARGRPADVLDEAEAGREVGAEVGQRLAEAAVGQHEPVVAAEEGEALAHRLDRVGEVGARRLGLGHRQAEAGVRLVEQVEGALEVAGPLAHLLLEHQRPLELGVGRAALVGRLLDAVHEDGDDLEELGVLPLDRIGGIEERERHGSGLAGRVDREAGEGLVDVDRVELLAVGREADDVVPGEDGRDLAHPWTCSTATRRRMQSQATMVSGGPPRESSASAASRWAAIGRACGDGEHEAGVDRREEGQVAVGLDLLDGADVVLAADADDDRVGGEDEGRELVGVLADEAGVLARRRLGVDLADDAGLGVGVGDDHLHRARLEVVELETRTGQRERTSVTTAASSRKAPSARGRRCGGSRSRRRPSRRTSGMAPSAPRSAETTASSRRERPSTRRKAKVQSQPGGAGPKAARAAATAAASPARVERGEAVDEDGARLEEAARGSRWRRSRPRRSRCWRSRPPSCSRRSGSRGTARPPHRRSRRGRRRG